MVSSTPASTPYLPTREGRGAVADDPGRITGGVGGRAEVEQADGKINAAAHLNATLQHSSRRAASAMAAGVAASASVSTSRDFEISQFCQKRQA